MPRNVLFKVKYFLRDGYLLNIDIFQGDVFEEHSFFMHFSHNL